MIEDKSMKFIDSISVEDIEKRKYPSKHYVYVILVKWSDETLSIVYRRYSKLFTFQTKLLDQFPAEAGYNNPEDRIIPFLPGKILFGRSHVQRVALKRQKLIDIYCKELISLPAKISQCSLVLLFFETKADDLTPKRKQSVKERSAEAISEPLHFDEYRALADYQKEQKNEVDLVTGMEVEVIEKNESGWWFVSVDQEQGWVPGSYLHKPGMSSQDDETRPSKHIENFAVVESYTAMAADEICLEKGTSVDVLKKSLDGWWYVKFKDKTGYVPALYLKRPDTLARNKLKRAMQLQQGNKGLPSRPPDKKKHSLPPRRSSLPRLQPVKPPRPKNPPVVEFYTTQDFQDHYNKDGISFSQGQTVKVIERSGTGWWYVVIEDKEGWAPSAYIARKSSLESSTKHKPEKPPLPKAKPKPDLLTTHNMSAKDSVANTSSALSGGKVQTVNKSSQKPQPPQRPDLPTRSINRQVKQNDSVVVSQPQSQSQLVSELTKQFNKK